MVHIVNSIRVWNDVSIFVVFVNIFLTNCVIQRVLLCIFLPAIFGDRFRNLWYYAEPYRNISFWSHIEVFFNFQFGNFIDEGTGIFKFHVNISKGDREMSGKPDFSKGQKLM